MFHFLINAELGHQPTIDLQNPDGTKTILGKTLDALDEAAQRLASEKGNNSLSEKIRNAEGRTLSDSAANQREPGPEKQKEGHVI